MIGLLTGATAVLAVLSLTFDFFWRKIPNLLTFPAILLGLTLHCVEGKWGGLLFSFLGLLMGIVFFFIPYALGGMGAGDVKLLAAVGALQGPGMVVLVFLYTALMGGVMIAIIFFLRKAGQKQRAFDFRGVWVNVVNLIMTRRPVISLVVPQELKGVQMPYGVAIGIGTLLALFVGRPGWL